MKHHNLNEQIEYDILEMSLSISAGALGFAITLFVISLLLPLQGQLFVVTTLYILLVPSCLVMSLTTYLTAKRIANKTPTSGGITASVLFALLVIVISISVLVNPSSSSSGLYTSLVNFPETDVEVLNTIASQDQRRVDLFIEVYSSNRNFDTFTRKQVDDLINSISGSIKEDIIISYMYAQHLLYTQDFEVYSREDILSHECYYQLHQQRNDLSGIGGIISDTHIPYVMRRIILASSLSSMIEIFTDLLSTNYYKDLYANLFAESELYEDLVSSQIANYLVYSYIDSSC
ncbi:MAG: hypothetical protein ACMXX9_00655 [Candidatus Woesearchaeota archaeon]